jgi:hypothetical protein
MIQPLIMLKLLSSSSVTVLSHGGRQLRIPLSRFDFAGSFGDQKPRGG